MVAPSNTINEITPVEQAHLLPRRMASLGLDANTVARFDPGTFSDLQGLCATCEYHARCQWDLRQDPANPTWQKYCPNWATLDSLGVLPWSAGFISF
jgi:hypothetical protein